MHCPKAFPLSAKLFLQTKPRAIDTRSFGTARCSESTSCFGGGCFGILTTCQKHPVDKWLIVSEKPHPLCGSFLFFLLLFFGGWGCLLLFSSVLSFAFFSSPPPPPTPFFSSSYSYPLRSFFCVFFFFFFFSRRAASCGSDSDSDSLFTKFYNKESVSVEYCGFRL